MDNAAMIAGLGATLLKAGRVSGMGLQAEPTTSL
jgi:tRNA A37 threonylcarbamoyltransferase TsaD